LSSETFNHVDVLCRVVVVACV